MNVVFNEQWNFERIEMILTLREEDMVMRTRNVNYETDAWTKQNNFANIQSGQNERSKNQIKFRCRILILAAQFRFGWQLIILMSFYFGLANYVENFEFRYSTLKSASNLSTLRFFTDEYFKTINGNGVVNVSKLKIWVVLNS